MKYFIRAQMLLEDLVAGTARVGSWIKDHRWTVFMWLVVLTNLISSGFALSNGKYNESFLYILVAALFLLLMLKDWTYDRQTKLLEDVLGLNTVLLAQNRQMLELIEDETEMRVTYGNTYGTDEN